MSVSYDKFAAAFLEKVTDYNFPLTDYERNGMVDGYMKRAIAQFRHVNRYDFSTTADDITRTFDVDVEDDDLDEIVDIVSEGMLVQWMKPYVYAEENLENALSTKDFTVYSPANLLLRIKEAYNQAKRDFVVMSREYSYNHGKLGDLHI